METSQERLRGHAKVFDSLLSLIPAKLYYGEDTSVRLLDLIPSSIPFYVNDGTFQRLTESMRPGSMAEEETIQGTETASKASEIGPGCCQKCEGCHGRESAETQARGRG
jgi:hypothetical protein